MEEHPARRQWRNQPLFISSTFRDMQAERDHLHDEVFPALEEWLRSYRTLLEPLDLRWGVETSDEGPAACNRRMCVSYPDQAEAEFAKARVESGRCPAASRHRFAAGAV